ncbi:hypothetical protein CP970_34765 [Streptomyces kanamyceticus]|uniref:MFS transporter n=1 Tax=Streptomyces kanamyceticus TaxID=1967 RepID=A0A5J6GNJ0_STRKN|nr:hypothetical protein CP970_34765 [Streptomyces kanamyceticus]
MTGQISRVRGEQLGGGPVVESGEPQLGQSLFGTPVNASIMAAAPPGMLGTSGGVGNTARTLGFTVGPAIAALAHGLGGGGAAGFRTGVVVLAVLQVAGILALLAAGGGGREAPADGVR